MSGEIGLNYGGLGYWNCDTLAGGALHIQAPNSNIFLLNPSKMMLQDPIFGPRPLLMVQAGFGKLGAHAKNLQDYVSPSSYDDTREYDGANVFNVFQLLSVLSLLKV